MPGTALVIMARYPEAGKTKTRLARSLGDERAARLYHAFLCDLAQRFAGQSYHLHWAYTPPEVDYQTFVRTLTPLHADAMTCFAQQGTDFEARLLHAFQWTHERGFDRTVLISSDSPHIGLHHIDDALQALEQADVVLGPADDGGYYLIAMHTPCDVFSGIPMSTSVVTDRTIAAAQRLGLSVSLIGSLFDIDELTDLQRLDHVLEGNRSLAPVTAAALASMRSFL